MLEEQNLVLSQIVYNILQDRYQRVSQTSFADGLSQPLFTSMVECWGDSESSLSYAKNKRMSLGAQVRMRKA
jgi:hypothetical protein